MEQGQSVDCGLIVDGVQLNCASASCNSLGRPDLTDSGDKKKIDVVAVVKSILLSVNIISRCC